MSYSTIAMFLGLCQSHQAAASPAVYPLEWKLISTQDKRLPLQELKERQYIAFEYNKGQLAEFKEKKA